MISQDKKLLLYLKYMSLLELNAKDYKVFLHILSMLSFKKFKTVKQKEIADELNLCKSDVSKAIKKLIEFEILSLNPYSVYKTKKKEVMLHDYSIDKLEDMIFDLGIKNNMLDYYTLLNSHNNDDVE